MLLMIQFVFMCGVGQEIPEWLCCGLDVFLFEYDRENYPKWVIPTYLNNYISICKAGNIRDEKLQKEIAFMLSLDIATNLQKET
jgi:hypothetical protein